MKSIVFFLLVVSAFFTWNSANRAWAEQWLYLASQQDQRIDIYTVDQATGQLKHRHRVELPADAGPMAFSPDQSMVYVAMNSQENGKPLAQVASMRRAADGSLSLVKKAKIVSRTPYIRTSRDGSLLLAAHYGIGEVTVYRIKDGVCTGELTDRKITEKTAHCIELDSTGKFAYVPHTTPNNVYQFRLDSHLGKLTPNTPPFVEGPEQGKKYHQPRHIVFHPRKNLAYTSNERGGGITAWRLDPKSGSLTKLQTLSTLPPGSDGNSAAADIHITPDARFVYVSNRDLHPRENNQGNDTLAGFSLDPETGRMELIGYFPTQHFPRTFVIDVQGKYLYAAGKKSNQMSAYRIDDKTGRLELIETYPTGIGPIWVMCAVH